MSKIAPVILVVVGLAAGLYLGFNPRTHQQLVQDWDHAKVSLVQATASLHAAPRVAVNSRATTRVEPVSAPPAATAAWKQISTAFESLVSSLQRLWLNLTARV